jgi:hypothetical protein
VFLAHQNNFPFISVSCCDHFEESRTRKKISSKTKRFLFSSAALYKSQTGKGKTNVPLGFACRKKKNANMEAFSFVRHKINSITNLPISKFSEVTPSGKKKISSLQLRRCHVQKQKKSISRQIKKKTSKHQPHPSRYVKTEFWKKKIRTGK